MSARTFYAFEHRYGVNTRDEDRLPIGKLHAFTSAIQRDYWVEEGPAYMTDAWARTKLLAREANRLLKSQEATHHKPRLVHLERALNSFLGRR